MVESSHHGLVPQADQIALAGAGMAGRASMPPPPGEPGAVQWRRIIAALLRHKWLVLLSIALGVGGGFAAGRFVTPVFETEVTIWIESGGGTRGGTDRGPIRSEELLREQGWVDLLRSYAVLDDAVQALRLYVGPAVPGDSALFRSFGLQERFATGGFELSVTEDGREWILATSGGEVVERGIRGDSIGSTVGFRWGPSADELQAGQTVAFTVQHPRDVSLALANRLATVADRNGTFLRASLQGEQPVLMTETLNEVTRRFVDLAAQLKREKLTELVGILGTQLETAGRNLRDAETELEDFQVRTITLPSERAVPVAPGLSMTRDPVFDSFFSMQMQLDELGRDRESIERVLAAVPDSGLPTGALEVIEAVGESSELMQALGELTERRAELRTLRSRYTDEHPPVRRLADDIANLERVVIPNLARGLAGELSSREQAIRERLGSASTQLRQIPARQVQEARLERRVEIAENLYTMLQGRFEEARLAEVSSVPDVRVLTPAIVPSRPVANRAPQLLLMGIVGGVGLGVGLSVLLDRIDRRVRYPDQVTAELGLPILGAVPRLKGGRNGGTGKDPLPVVEAIRGIRLNLVHAYGAAGPILVTITSPGSGDGKSFVASNLALAFADAGYKTLLVDADTRRGALHRIIGGWRKPGLVDALDGSAGIDGVVQETEYQNLHFVGGGTRKGGAPELLGSPAMTRLLTSVRSSYSVIIVDSPPLGAGVDAYALGTATGNILLVMRTGVTDRTHAEAALDVLDRLPVRLLGAVLNDVRAGQAYGYYHTYYMPGYESEDETTGHSKQLIGRKSE